MKNLTFSKLNPLLWGGWLIFCSLVFLYFFYHSIADLSRFFSLNQKVSATNVHFKIVENHKDQFQIKAEFSYVVDGQEYKRAETLTQPIYDNPYQAQKVLQERIESDFDVYYSKRKPSLGTLQKEFSIKKFVDMLLGTGLFCYFLFLKENYLENIFKKFKKYRQ